MKIESKHVSPYLPFGLKGIYHESIITLSLNGFSSATEIGYDIALFLKCKIKPIMRPLSDLTKEITHNGETFVPIEEYHYLRFEEIANYKSGGIWLNHIYVKEYNVLIELHFDIFGLIDNGLAIDINTLDCSSK
jgi:hypothetical protein